MVLFYTAPPQVEPWLVVVTCSTTVDNFYKLSKEKKRKGCKKLPLAWNLFPDPASPKQTVVKVATKEGGEQQAAGDEPSPDDKAATDKPFPMDDIPPKKGNLSFLYLLLVQACCVILRVSMIYK